MPHETPSNHGEGENPEARLRMLEEENDRLKQQLARLEELATKDPLTGLDNRRGLHEKMEMGRPPKDRAPELREKQKPAAVLVLDIDNFKTVNDVYGHKAGDEILKRAARTLTETVRRGDYVCRWGGEEFVVVFRNATAQDIIDKFHGGRTIAGLSFETEANGEKTGITFSGGVTELTADESIEKAVERADRALYAAKNEGRNKIKNADEETG